MQNRFGEELKEWRNQRRISQLELGLSANVSARHISFLETGRAKPSQSMVRQLCETLEIPRSARNTILTAAGFAPTYLSRDLDEANMAHVRDAVNWTLERHDPYPAFALDKHWLIVKANKAAGFLLEGAGLVEGDSLLDIIIDKTRLAAILENWQEVMHHMYIRLRTESAHFGGDPVLDAAIAKLTKALDNKLPEASDIHPAVIPAKYKAGDLILTFFSTIAQFGSAEDIALSELKIEMMFPANDLTRNTLITMVEAGDTLT